MGFLPDVYEEMRLSRGVAKVIVVCRGDALVGVDEIWGRPDAAKGCVVERARSKGIFSDSGLAGTARTILPTAT